jgi:hypothetical protein
MTNRFCTVSAAAFALLFVTVPARAATIEVVNLHFNGGDQLTGNINFLHTSRFWWWHPARWLLYIPTSSFLVSQT